MLNEEYEKLYNLEKDFWWFKGIRKILFSLIDKYNKKNDLKILDAGCGTGFLLTQLQKYGEVHGIDLSEEAIEFCKKRNLTNIQKASIENLPYEKESFDLVTSIDVIYHTWIDSDLHALKEMNRVLKQDGLLLVQVASYNFMKSNHDKAVMTKLRYTKKDLKEKLENSGFKVEKITYANTILFPFALIKRLTEKSSNSSEVQKIPNFLNSIFTKTLYLEANLLKHMNFPYGLSLIAVAKKR